MSRVAKTIITAEDKTKPGITSAINNVLDLDGATKKLGKTIATSLTAVGIVSLGKQFVQFGAEAVIAFGEVERKMLQLKTALGGNDASFNRMNDHIETLSRLSLSSKGDIQGLVAQLASLGKSDADIKRISEAAVKLSNVTGQGLNEAMKQVNATFSGSTDELGKLIPEMKGLTKEQLAAGGAVDLLNSKFADITASMSGGVSQSIKNTSDSYNDFKVAFGDQAWVNSMVVGITRILNIWTDTINEAKRYGEIKKKLAEDQTNQDKLFLAGKRYDTAVNALSLEGKSNSIGTVKFSDQQRNELKADRDAAAREMRDLTEAIRLETKKAPERAVSSSTPPYKAEAEWWAEVARLLPDASNKMLYGELFDDIAKSNALVLNGITDAMILGVNTAVTLANPDRVGVGSNDLGLGNIGAGRGDTGVDIGMSGIGNFSDIMSSLGGGFSKLLGSVMPMVNSLSSVTQILNPLQTIFSSMMEVLGPVINEALAPIVGILKVLGKMLAAVLMPSMKLLAPVLEMISRAFVWLYNEALVPVANAFIWFGTALNNVWVDIYNGLRKFLKKIGINIGSKMDRQDASDNYLERISYNDLVSEGSTPSTGAGTGGGASYTGSQAITFNFYNQGNVVGSGGLEELAAIIKSLIDRNARYA
jgi:hypothetical protein